MQNAEPNKPEQTSQHDLFADLAPHQYGNALTDKRGALQVEHLNIVQGPVGVRHLIVRFMGPAAGRPWNFNLN